ncbi:3-ketoacyl-ACP synthase [Bacillus pseudomycoides]|nr:3-ketoacyl-ACP synthase [Bacillus pseudomycoides]
MKKVVVTGIGIVAPNGIGKEKFWSTLLSGKSCIQRDSEMEDLELNSTVLAKVKDFNALNYCEEEEFSDLLTQDRFVQFGVIAGKLAIEDAQLTSNYLNSDRAGITFASAIGGTTTATRMFEELSDYGKDRIQHKPIGDVFYNAGMFNYPAVLLARKYGLQGPCTSLSTGCTAGLDTLGLGYEMIKSGEMDLMLVGASEAPLTGLTYATLDIIGSLSSLDCEPEKASRPFDAKRKGFVISEGSTFFTLESEEHAIERGAKIYAEVLGYSSVSNAHHMTNLQENGEPMSRVIKQALEVAKIEPQAIDYINAHGSSTPQNDVFETNAYKDVFGQYAYSIPISSTKSMIGHSLSSASLMGTASSLLAIENAIVHPTANYEVPDPLCDLDYVPNEARQHPVHNALVTASGFGGIHSAAILSKYGG